MTEIILVVAAHPDDEVLGCGGTIAAHARRGDRVHVAILAEGVTSRGATRNRKGKSRDLSALAKAAKRANRALGVSSVDIGKFPDNRMDGVDLLDVVKKIEALVVQHRPSIVYTHHAGDLNVDHQRTNQAVVTACRPLPGGCVKSLLFFEVLSSTDFQAAGCAVPFVPNHFVDIAATLAQKLEALRCYESEMRPWPHSRSLKAIEHLARSRGANVGREAAEAFMLGRRIV